MRWMVLPLFFLLTISSHADETSPTIVKESSDYEVDYEEEPGDEEPVIEAPVEEEPVKKKSNKTKTEKLPKDTSTQGSRATNRFQPMIKSESKSHYKKNGKSLDVDPD